MLKKWLGKDDGFREHMPDFSLLVDEKWYNTYTLFYYKLVAKLMYFLVMNGCPLKLINVPLKKKLAF